MNGSGLVIPPIVVRPSLALAGIQVAGQLEIVASDASCPSAIVKTLSRHRGIPEPARASQLPFLSLRSLSEPLVLAGFNASDFS